MRAPKPPAAPGFSLLELLFAIAMAALVVALLLSVHVVTIRALESRQQYHADVDEAAAALRRMRQELLGVFLPGDEEQGRFLLGPAEAAGREPDRLRFCSMAPGDAGAAWPQAVQIGYRLARGDSGALLRWSRPLAGPGASTPPATNVVARGIRRFDARAFDGSAWVTVWPPGEKAALPKAVRIEIAAGHDTGPSAVLRTEILIPVGTVVTSRLTRAGSGAVP